MLQFVGFRLSKSNGAFSCRMHMVIYIRDLPEIFQWTEMICQVQMLEIIECFNTKSQRLCYIQGENVLTIIIGTWILALVDIYPEIQSWQRISIFVNFNTDNHFPITRQTSSTAHWQQHFNQPETMPWICCPQNYKVATEIFN